MSGAEARLPVPNPENTVTVWISCPHCDAMQAVDVDKTTARPSTISSIIFLINDKCGACKKDMIVAANIDSQAGVAFPPARFRPRRDHGR